MKNRIRNWRITNNKYRQEFDQIYNTAWEDIRTKACPYEKTSLSDYNDYIQFTLIAIGVLFVIIGSIFDLIVDQNKDTYTIIIVIGMGLLFVECLVVHKNLLKIGFYERKMLVIEEVFNRMVSGYKNTVLADKLVQIEVFALKYRKSPAARICQYILVLVGIYMQALVVYVGIMGNYINWSDISKRNILIWITLVVVLNYLTAYFASGRVYNFGHYKLVTVKYRNWLLNA